MRITYFLSILCYFLVCSQALIGQTVTYNDGFEGTPQVHNPPTQWHNCTANNSTIDTQPGPFDNKKPASEGDSYISITTRGPSSPSPGSFEVGWTNLLLKFEPGKCYNLLIDLSLSNEFKVSTWSGDFYFDAPCRFQIIGKNDDCANISTEEILWDSGVLTKYDWETFDLTIQPDSFVVEKLMLRAFFADEQEYTNSVVLVDNLRYNYSNDLIYSENGMYYLPDWAQDISWYFYGELIENANSHEIPLLVNGSFKAHFYDEDGCLHIAKKEVSFDFGFIQIYPNPVKDLLLLEFLGVENEPIKIDMYDAIGKHVLEVLETTENGINELELNVRSLSPGKYTLKVLRNNSLLHTEKIIISQ